MLQYGVVEVVIRGVRVRLFSDAMDVASRDEAAAALRRARPTASRFTSASCSSSGIKLGSLISPIEVAVLLRDMLVVVDSCVYLDQAPVDRESNDIGNF